LSAVNFPEVSLPGHPNSQRLLHIHKNVPGILSRINEIFSRESINIDAQFLQTDTKVGYVVIDVSTSAEHAGELRTHSPQSPAPFAQESCTRHKEARLSLSILPSAQRRTLKSAAMDGRS
jgi:hypothetical protein